MKKCCFIIPYFGRLPKHFKLFLKTCEYNKNYDWLIITDDKTRYILPENVIMKKMSFEQLKIIIQDKFEFKISLEAPYKLCDYKPAYGYIFEDYIKEKYKFWGHCDLDTIMGDLDDFLTDGILKKYDKIFELGHMILYKNTYENNRIFMNKHNGRWLYKEAFQKEKIDVFDEFYFEKENIGALFEEKNKMIYKEDLSFNISSRVYQIYKSKVRL